MSAVVQEVLLIAAELRIILARASRLDVKSTTRLLLGAESLTRALVNFYHNLQVAAHVVIMWVVRLLRMEKNVAALSSSVLAFLQSPTLAAGGAAACFVALLVLLLFATKDVNVELLQFVIDDEKQNEAAIAATSSAAVSEPLAQVESKSVYGAIRDTIVGQEHYVVSPVKLSIPSDESWKEINHVRVKSPKSRWMTGGSAGFFSRLRPSSGKAGLGNSTSSNASGSGGDNANTDYKLSTAGLKRWSPSKDPPRSPLYSPAGSIPSEGGNTTPTATRKMNRAQSTSDAAGGESGEVTLTDDLTDSPNVGGSVQRRRSLSLGTDADFDPRSVIGKRVLVKGVGLGVVKDVRRSLFFGKTIYDIDFGTGKISRVSLKSGTTGLPFKLA